MILQNNTRRDKIKKFKKKKKKTKLKAPLNKI